MPTPRTFWRTHVAALPAIDRRLALYALQLLDGAPELKRRLHDRDFLGALWQLLQPVMHPRAVARFMAQPDDDGDDDELVEWEDALIQPQNDRYLREQLRRNFDVIPRTLLKRMVQDDAAATLSPTVALLGEQLALDSPTRGVLDFLDQHILSEPLRTLLRECGRAPARVNLPRLAALLGLAPATLRETLSRNAPLRTLGLVRYEDDQSDLGISCTRAICCAGCWMPHRPMVRHCSRC